MTEDQKLRRQAKKAERTPEQNRAALKRKVRMFYDLQRLRMQAGGRTLKRATEIELHEADVALLAYRSKELHAAEKAALKDVESHLKGMPVYEKILSQKPRFRGVGPTLAGVLIAEIDIARAPTASALWRYAGLAPIPAKRCKHCNDVVVGGNRGLKHEANRKKKCKFSIVPLSDTYDSAKSEKPTKGVKLPYNAFLKTKLMGVMTGCLLKAGSPYRRFYDNYKHRIISAGKGVTDGHRNMMAQRYMIKMLLLELWKDWRELEGLDVRVPYQEEYLDHVHHG